MRFSTLFAATALWVMQTNAQDAAPPKPSFGMWDAEGVSIVCNKTAGTRAGDVVATRVNADYLSKIKDEKPQNGPGLCGQVACNYGTTIIWCNNNPTPMTLDSFQVIVDGWGKMQSFLTGGTPDDCVQLGPPGLKAVGEIFHPNGFSVRVGGNGNC